MDYIVHYLNETSYSRFASKGGFAVVTSDVTGLDASNMNDFTGPFLVFSFLVQPVSLSGFRPVTPDVLSDDLAWNMVLNTTTATYSYDKNKQILLTYKTGANRWEIQFYKDLINGLLMPEVIKFYTEVDGIEMISRRLVVNKYRVDSNLNVYPEKMTLECHVARQRGNKKSGFLAATFDYTVETNNVNSPISDEVFEFDPSTASRIWDADQKVFITIPN
ncbi:MAG: hypothetical protein HC904_10930 [Blastochloris sp.]|nr:hypothetical protein [Blastochloris sp.]